jgi:purine nucleosidase/pyrimidine-specific ribonucleoside hydrolase
LTLFVSGAFTNLAQALRLDPGIKDNIAAVYFMGGAARSPGNIRGLDPGSSNTVAEWNIYVDPQAAREVFESGLDLYMIPLDATGQVMLSQEEITPWHTGGKGGDLAADLYDILFTDLGLDTVEVFDLTAAVIMARPELCGFESLHMDVVTEAGNTSGQTRIAPDGEPNIHVCLEPDATG